MSQGTLHMEHPTSFKMTRCDVRLNMTITKWKLPSKVKATLLKEAPQNCEPKQLHIYVAGTRSGSCQSAWLRYTAFSFRFLMERRSQQPRATAWYQNVAGTVLQPFRPEFVYSAEYFVFRLTSLPFCSFYSFRLLCFLMDLTVQRLNNWKYWPIQRSPIAETTPNLEGSEDSDFCPSSNINVETRTSVEQWWNGTDRGKLKCWEKNIIQRGW